jgi:hypothetical protein
VTSKLNGKSQFGAVARTLPVRRRVALALLAADLALERLKSSPDYATGRNAFALGQRWYDGQPVDPDRIEDALHDEDDKGINLYAQEAQSAQDRAAWSVLDSALGYAAYHAYIAAGQLPGSLVSEVKEGEEFGCMDQQLRLLFGRLPGVLTNVAKHLLNQRAPQSFAQLKSTIATG